MVVQDLVRYDSCKVALDYCDARLLYLEGVILKKDQILNLYTQNQKDLLEIEQGYINQIEALEKNNKKVKLERNIAIGGALLIIILAIL